MIQQNMNQLIRTSFPEVVTMMENEEMIEWVLIPKFADLTGYTQSAVRHKINDGKWPPSLWRKAPDGRIHVNYQEYKKWVLGA